MVLGDVEETVTTQEVDQETEEEIIRTSKRQIEMLFVRGDAADLQVRRASTVATQFTRRSGPRVVPVGHAEADAHRLALASP